MWEIIWGQNNVSHCVETGGHERRVSPSAFPQSRPKAGPLAVLGQGTPNLVLQMESWSWFGNAKMGGFVGHPQGTHLPPKVSSPHQEDTERRDRFDGKGFNITNT